MAKVNIEFDTKTKELSVTFDGKKVDNVSYVSLSKNYYEEDADEFGMTLNTMDSSNMDGEGYRSMQCIVAKYGKGAKEALAAGAGTHPLSDDFLLLKKSSLKAEKSLSDLLRSHRNR